MQRQNNELASIIEAAADRGNWMVVIKRHLTEKEKQYVRSLGHDLVAREGKYDYTTVYLNTE